MDIPSRTYDELCTNQFCTNLEGSLSCWRTQSLGKFSCTQGTMTTLNSEALLSFIFFYTGNWTNAFILFNNWLICVTEWLLFLGRPRPNAMLAAWRALNTNDFDLLISLANSARELHSSLRLLMIRLSCGVQLALFPVLRDFWRPHSQRTGCTHKLASLFSRKEWLAKIEHKRQILRSAFEAQILLELLRPFRTLVPKNSGRQCISLF